MKDSPAATHQQIASVLWNRPESHAYYRIALACDTAYETARPGQFVTLHLPGNLAPLLRRPFSIHRLIRKNHRITGVEILYKVVGGFTEKLTRVAIGDPVDLLGPLGNGFTVVPKFQKIALIGGGIGIAPLIFLAQTLRETGMDLSESIVCLGGRTSEDILCKQDFQDMGFSIRITSDDGSEGESGTVIQPFKKWIGSNQTDMIYACGPMPMLRAIADMANKNKIPCEVSIETIMACGLGACLGCAVNKNEDTGKYQHVCIDGPVFDAAKLVF